jgi:hypothetical protein
MYDQDESTGRRAGLQTPMRNRYFYGQLLGVYNFELETNYAIRQRRLLNRLVLGYGVVCGLNVELTNSGHKIIVGPGLAIDRHGREIVVPQPSAPITIPPAIIKSAAERAKGGDDEACVQVVICYHEYHGDQVPVRAGDCELEDPCAPSTLREQYRIEFRDRCARRPRPRCHAPDLISGSSIDHDALARFVTSGRNCTTLPADPCVPLANLQVIDSDTAPHCHPDGVDISVRPVLASNVVLMELILALLEEAEEPDYE